MNGLNNLLQKTPWVTLIVVVTAIIVVLVGAIKVIQGDMTYDEWVGQLWKFAAAAGLTGIGRGIHSGLTAHGIKRPLR